MLQKQGFFLLFFYIELRLLNSALQTAPQTILFGVVYLSLF